MVWDTAHPDTLVSSYIAGATSEAGVVAGCGEEEVESIPTYSAIISLQWWPSNLWNIWT